MRDILSEYGPDSAMDQKPRASNGGVMPVRDVHNYCPPLGPTSIHDHGPGLHENNYGNCGTQGPKSTPAKESGRPGLHGGRNMGHGTNR